MVTQTDHIEVAPRMWDKTLAANYIKQKAQESVDDAVSVANEAFTEQDTSIPFFTYLKKFMIPVLFVLGCIVVIYVLWMYFTKYKNAQPEHKPKTKLIKESNSQKDNLPQLTVDDLSKYEYESDESNESDDDAISIEKYNKEHNSEESDDEATEETEESDDEEMEEESDNDETEDEEAEDIPDLDHIQKMINSDISEELPPLLEDDEFSLEIPYTTMKSDSKPKKHKKLSRVTL